MIIPMTTTGRRQRRYDHRLRDLVQRTGDVTIAKDLGVPRSTARGWLGDGQTAVVSLDVASLKTLELEQEVLELRRRVKKLTALLRLVLALLRSSGFTLTHERLPDGRDKTQILRAVDRARDFVPLRSLLRFLRLTAGVHVETIRMAIARGQRDFSGRTGQRFVNCCQRAESAANSSPGFKV